MASINPPRCAPTPAPKLRIFSEHLFGRVGMAPRENSWEERRLDPFESLRSLGRALNFLFLAIRLMLYFALGHEREADR